MAFVQSGEDPSEQSDSDVLQRWRELMEVHAAFTPLSLPAPETARLLNQIADNPALLFNEHRPTNER